MKECVKKCLGQLTVSCQAYDDTPFYGPENIKKFVECAVMGGSKVVRCCWPQDIAAARSVSKDLVIIGIYKKTDAGEPDPNDIFITPTFDMAKQCVEAGADIVAFDARCTPKRSREQLLAVLKEFAETYPEIGVMADCSTLEDCLWADQCGYVDIVSTTLSVLDKPYLTGPDVELIHQCKQQCTHPINAEGKIWDLYDLDKVEAEHPDMICIGSAITRPHLIAQRFINHHNKANSK